MPVIDDMELPIEPLIVSGPAVSPEAERAAWRRLAEDRAAGVEMWKARALKYETALRTIVDNYSLKGGNPAQDGAIARAALKE